jgi:DNA modification methylase
MARPKPEARNRLFYGDNLDVLRRKIKDESVDLCYIDPPFNSNRRYFQIYNNIGGEDRAQAQAFVDTWEWGDEAVAAFDYVADIGNLQNGKITPQTVGLIKGLEVVLGRGALFAYILHMTLRILEIHRVLKPEGSFYLHCDPTASHYLKIVLDGVFCGQGGDFKNEIIWSYKKWAVAGRSFSRNHDVILFYTKSTDSETFNVLLQDRAPSTLKRFGTKKIVSGHSADGKRVPSQTTSEDSTGVKMSDVWELPIIAPVARERLGYPTQKPESLLERVIAASSNPEDVVLDAYCGCGTTVAVAQRMGRRWIGIDITYQSISLILKRLEDQYPMPEEWSQVEGGIHLDGVPRDKASAIALANRSDDRTRKEFEKWALLTYSRNQARINEKSGADGGVDGIAYIVVSATENGKVIFQVKSGGANRATMATLNSDRIREGAEIGILITMESPTTAMKKEVAAAGKFKHPMLNREDDRLQIVTVEQLLSGVRIDLPMGRTDHVKEADAVGDSNKQIPLV